MTRVVNESQSVRDDLPLIRFSITIFDGCLQLYCTNAAAEKERFVSLSSNFIDFLLFLTRFCVCFRDRLLLLPNRRASLARVFRTWQACWATMSG
jgi:hypothetical protein